MTTDERTHDALQVADTAISFLNDLMRLDPDAILALVDHRVPCNAALADHPTVQVSPGMGPLSTAARVGMLGILNGLVGIREDGWGYIALDLDSRRFVRTSPNAAAYQAPYSARPHKVEVLTTCRSPNPERTAATVVAFLNGLAELDPDAIKALMDHTVPCNQALADSRIVPVFRDRVEGGSIGVLSILNGLVGVREAGKGYISCGMDSRSIRFYLNVDVPLANPAPFVLLAAAPVSSIWLKWRHKWADGSHLNEPFQYVRLSPRETDASFKDAVLELAAEYSDHQHYRGVEWEVLTDLPPREVVEKKREEAIDRMVAARTDIEFYTDLLRLYPKESEG